MPSSTVIVIGAGMTGLTAATRLADRGIESVILDKGRAPGGRMASRTIDDARFDHGAQHFGARSDLFRNVVTRWVEAGVARPWFDAGSPDPRGDHNTRFVGVGGMRSIPEYLARDLSVRLGVAVTELQQHPEGLAAMASSEEVATGRAVIITPPVPQTFRLLNRSGISPPLRIQSALEQIRYNPCLAVMARLDGPSGLPNGHLTPDDGDIAWIADNEHKGISPSPAITIHSSVAFARTYLEDEPAEWEGRLRRGAQELVQSTIVSAQGHRWRFSEPQTTLDVGAMAFDDGFPVVLAGEVFRAARVEGAYLSGVAAADEVLARL